MGRLLGVLAVMLACAAEPGPVADADPGTDTESPGSTGDPVPDVGSTDEPTGNGPPLPPRPDTQHCRFDGWAPGLLAPLEVEPALDEPVAGAQALAVDSEGGFVWVGTDDGRVLTFDVDDPAAPAVESWPSNSDAATGLAVDPANRFLFVRFEQTGPATVVRRYAYDDAGLLDPQSMVRVLFASRGPDSRAGAGLALDLDGNLVIPLGDGGYEDEPGPAEERSDRRGNVLRLDVTVLEADYGTGIPSDNPWSDEPSPANESWAIGMRDPAGCSVDSEDGSLWCFDIGANASEVTMTEMAANLGWPHADGPDCLLPTGDCFQLPIVRPDGVYRYGDDECGSAIGAVARDGPFLDGVAIFGDRCSGTVWAADTSRAGRVGEWDPPPAAFANDANGTVWTVDAEGSVGRVRVVPTEGVFPEVLSQSGCFDDLAALEGAPDLIPYEINAALWTDGAIKRRHIVLPVGEQIHVEDDGALVYPEGTALLKTFSFETHVETRVMIKRQLGWEFHTYEWNNAGTEAALLDARKQVMLQLPEQTLAYDYPSRAECGYCHGSTDARPLGPRLEQMARDVSYGDQLAGMEAIGVFDGPLPTMTPMAGPGDEEASLEARARSYLHTNCGHCHRPGGWVPPQLAMDLRWVTPTKDAEICGERVRYFNPWVDAEHRVAPGDPDDSAIFMRQQVRDLGQMPPLATQIVDPDSAVVGEWIASLQECPG